MIGQLLTASTILPPKIWLQLSGLHQHYTTIISILNWFFSQYIELICDLPGSKTTRWLLEKGRVVCSSLQGKASGRLICFVGLSISNQLDNFIQGRINALEQLQFLYLLTLQKHDCARQRIAPHKQRIG